jgi:hypothetical protein
MNWEDAVKLNKPLPCGDHIYIKGNDILHKVCKNGDYLDYNAVSLVIELADFIIEEQVARRSSHPASREWENFCAQAKIHNACLGPRWTMPFCYFGIQHKDRFYSLCGLDIGCNVLPRALRSYSDQFIARTKQSGLYAYEYEVLVPHYEYYRSWGCNMRGIDLHPFTNSYMVSQCDLRMLDFPDSSIDFYTVAMIIGPSNSASTILDAAMCFSELYRTSTKNSIIYIADFVITPVVVLLAIEFGFKVFTNELYMTGIPIGVFLVRTDCDIRESSFSSVISELESREILVDKGRSRLIGNRELLRRDTIAPRELIAQREIAGTAGSRL